MTPDPITFLHAALDAAQAEAEAATPGPWFANEQADYDCDFEATIGTGTGSGLEDATDVVGHGYEGGGVHKLADAAHIARHDPAAVLRLIAAERELIAECEAAHNWDNWGASSLANDVIRSLAAGWGWTDGEHPPSV